MDWKKIEALLIDHFYIGLPIIALILLFLIKGEKRSNHYLLHFCRLIAELALVFLIQEYCYLLLQHSDIHLISYSDLNFATAVVIGLILIKEGFLFLKQFELILIKKGYDVTSIKFLMLALKIVFVVFLVFTLGQHFGFSLAGLMTFGGIGGLAIGLAAKDILSNFFSGFMLYFTRPFNIGDWISSPDKQIEGVVKEIGWHETVILTFENRPLHIPNSIFSAISIENPGQMLNRRIKTSLGLRYDDLGKIKIITQQIEQYLKNNDKIDQNQVILVYFNEFGASSVNVLVWCYTKTTKWAEWLAIQQQVYLDMIDIVHQNGADFAWNTQLLYLQQNQETPTNAPTSESSTLQKNNASNSSL